MHYVSWDRTDRDNLKLLAEAGPEVLGVFTHDKANVGGEQWDLVVSPESGAVAARDGVEIVRAHDSLKRARQITVEVEGRRYEFVGETSQNWIVDDANGTKVGQFTSDHNGVRKAILEFEGETSLPLIDVASLAWISREILEARKLVSSNVLIATLLLFSLVAVMVFVL